MAVEQTRVERAFELRSRTSTEKAAASEVHGSGSSQDSVSPVLVALAWAAVGLPLAWGAYRTLLSLAKFFNA